MTRIALIGSGAIASALMAALRDDASLRIVQIVVPSASLTAARDACAALAPGALVRSALDLTTNARPDLLVECAGHAALDEHVLPALRAGVPAIVVSIGALHDAALLARLEQAATAGNTRIQLVAGAIGGVDAIAAARYGGLEQVSYIGRKPPAGWRGTPAEALCDLSALREAKTIFEGSAREAARLYPKNANVAATLSLAGLGLDATRATLIADPGVTRNVHRIVASGAFGKLDLTFENEPLPANPKTSALTVCSVLRAIHNATGAIAI